MIVNSLPVQAQLTVASERADSQLAEVKRLEIRSGHLIHWTLDTGHWTLDTRHWTLANLLTKIQIIIFYPIPSCIVHTSPKTVIPGSWEGAKRSTEPLYFYLD